MLDPSQRRKPRRVWIVVLAGGSLVSAYSASDDPVRTAAAIDSTPSNAAMSMLFVLIFIFALSLFSDVRRAVRAALPEAVDALIRWLRTIGRR
ncbi:MAG: hypothetical protein JWM18_2560 [Chloroflexi bacterium]|jgi:hypothetical protein|nr:hypothetical protein [Chloroflexota bacterium]